MAVRPALSLAAIAPGSENGVGGATIKAVLPDFHLGYTDRHGPLTITTTTLSLRVLIVFACGEGVGGSVRVAQSLRRI